MWGLPLRSMAAVTAAIVCVVAAMATQPVGDPLREALRDEQVAGIVWTTIDGPVTRSGAAGLSNRTTGQPMLPGNRVHVGSVTKTFIAVGILKLVSDGKLRLDDPVEPLLPAVRFGNAWAGTHPVRVRHLLDHTAGLEDARIWQVFSSRSTPDQPLGEVFTRDPSVLELRTPPGEVFSYSNMGYTLAAMIIEQVTGERYEHWLGRELLDPLGMKDSTFGFVSQQGPSGDPRLAWGHLGDGTLAAALPVAVRPSTQFSTTAADMARFARFLMSDGRIGDRMIVRDDLLRQMGQVADTAAARAGLKTGYALGLAKRDRAGSVGLCHQGDTVGYHALLCIYPAEQKAFFLALNSDGDGIDLPRFHRILLDRTAPQRARPSDPGKVAEGLNQWAGHYRPLVSRFAIGRYAEVLDGGVKLRAETGRLVLERSGKAPLTLHPLGAGLFRATDRIEPSHVLYIGDGTAILSDGQRTFRKVSSIAHYGLWLNFGFGLVAAAYLLLSLPLLALKGRRSFAEPALLCLLAFLPSAFLLYRLPFSQWGDVTGASLFLFAATAALPVGLLVQMLKAGRQRYTLWQAEMVAGLGVLQWLAVLAWFGLVPFRLWH